MASDNSVNLVYSVSDSVEWSKYIVDILSQVGLDVRCVELSSSGSMPAWFTKFIRGQVIILLASPGFLKSLLAGDSFDAHVTQRSAGDSANPVVLFFCGTSMKDFEEVDIRGRRLSDRFSGLLSWSKFTHEEMSQLPRTVCDLIKKPKKPKSDPNPNKKPQKLRPKMNFRLVPDEVRCEVWYLRAFNFFIARRPHSWSLMGGLFTFGTTMRGLGVAAARPDPSSLYQM